MRAWTPRQQGTDVAKENSITAVEMQTQRRGGWTRLGAGEGEGGRDGERNMEPDIAILKPQSQWELKIHSQREFAA